MDIPALKALMDRALQDSVSIGEWAGHVHTVVNGTLNIMEKIMSDQDTFDAYAAKVADAAKILGDELAALRAQVATPAAPLNSDKADAALAALTALEPPVAAPAATPAEAAPAATPATPAA